MSEPQSLAPGAAADAVPGAASYVSPGGGNPLQLMLATVAFAVCFAVFGSISAMMPLISERLNLSESQKGLAIAIPVLLGSLGRIPLGILTDRMGGRMVYLACMVGSIIPAVAAGFANSFAMLLICGFFAGIALAVFPIGIGMVNGWYPPARQGLALGIYGAGNIGQALAAFGAPVLARRFGYAWGFWSFAVLTAVWLVVFFVLAKDAPRKGRPRGLAEFLAPLRDRRSWALSLYYFLTFGGFVAMASYLPLFLKTMFNLTPADAGFRTAGFVVLATGMRPLGGYLADRVGGRTVLKMSFVATAVMAIFMACPLMTTFTVGALGMAAVIGLGNGAVFKLVPEYFPQSVGSVTGLVGAAGGLGGFFPPLVVGTLRGMTGSFSGGFILLSVFAVACLLVLMLGRPQSARSPAC